jgi:outer membrane lipoprotein-sorting protein
VDRVPLSSTPLNVLLDDDIDFEAEVETLQILKWPDQVAITVQSLSGDVEGMLTLLFDSDAKTLIGWRSIDTEGLTTQITLSGVETGLRLNPRLFRLDEPADEDDER